MRRDTQRVAAAPNAIGRRWAEVDGALLALGLAAACCASRGGLPAVRPANLGSLQTAALSLVCRLACAAASLAAVAHGAAAAAAL